MDRSRLDQQLDLLCTLAEPARRQVYFYVSARPVPVSRDEAAEAVGVTRALAAFHLDKLVEEGLLDVEYRRLSGRRGPGAGRPHKLYKRSARKLEISLPQRDYELAARVLAEALAAKSTNGKRALGQVARRFGKRLGVQANQRGGRRGGVKAKLKRAEEALIACGYEPFREKDGAIRLRNCPFHALALDYPDVVCRMNRELIQGISDGLEMPGGRARLEPQPGMCCVTLHARPASEQSAGR